MKKIFSFLTAILFAGSMMAEVGEVFYTFVPQKPKGAISDYTKTGDQTIDDMTWTVPGNQYGNGELRLGGKSLDAVDRTITGKTAMGDAISQIVITHAGVTADKLQLNSVKVTVASDAAFSADVETVTLASGTDFTIAKNTSGTITLTPANDFWAKDSYYKFDFNITNPNSTNYAWVLNKIEFYSYAAGGETPSTTKTIYCKNEQAWWLADGATVGVYAFADGDVKNAAWPGVRMTAVEGETNLWKADIDTAKYEKIIFVRVNGTGDLADWGAQTEDLAVPADKDLYTITSTSAQWSGEGNKVTGTWSVYKAGDDPVVDEPAVIKLHGNFTGDWANTAAFTLSEDKKTATLKLTLNKGNYEFGMRIGADDNWTSNGVAFTRENKSAAVAAGTGNLKLAADTKGDYTFTWTYATNTLAIEFPEYVETLPVMQIAGAWDVKNEAWVKNDMTAAEDKKTASYEVELKAGDYEFKVIKDGAWLTKANEGNAYGLHREWTGVANVKDEATENLKLTADVDGKYTFVWTFANDSLGVIFPEKPAELQAVSAATTWDFSKITANTGNALYNKEGIQLTDESTPSKNDEMVYANYTADFMTFAEGFDAATMAFKGEYPIRKNQYCQAGTLHFKTTVAGTITVKFSDTGSSASATAVKRYLVVNGEQTEYWTSRENNGEEPYEARLNVTSGEIAVPAGDVTITGSSAIVVYNVTFTPKVEEPAKFYITGDSALVTDAGFAGKAWNPAAIKAEADTLVLNLKAEQVYKLKVTLDGTWNTAKGFNDLTEKPEGVTMDNDENIIFSLAEAGAVKVIYIAGETPIFKLIGNFYVEPTPVDAKFYVTGDSALVTDAGFAGKAWNPAAIKAEADTLVLNLKAEQVYKLKVTLDGTWNTAKGFNDLTEKPEGVTMDNDENIIFSLAEAGAVKVIYIAGETPIFKLEGNFYVDPTPVVPTAAVTGDMTEWGEPIPFELSEDSTFATLYNDNIKKGTYAFKMIINGNWRSNGYEFHRGFPGCAGITGNTDANMTVVIDVEGAYTFKWYFANDSLAIIYPEKPEPAFKDGFYLVGKFGGVDAWGIDANKIFTANPSAEGEYMLENVTLAEGDLLKVVRVEKDEIKTWFPDGIDTDYAVDAAHAGVKTIYFRADGQGGEGWHAGCIFVAPNDPSAITNVNADAKAVKSLKNGILMIEKDGKVYNVIGLQIR